MLACRKRAGRKEEFEAPSTAELRVLHTLLLSLLVDDEARYYAVSDVSGTKPMHALLIANNNASLKLFRLIVEDHPERLLDAHGKGPYT